MRQRLREEGYYGLYRGRVVDNTDPSKSGRIKVDVHGIYDGVAVQDLPWAEPCFPIGGFNNYGSCYVPTIGSLVFVLFENGLVEDPIYIGGAPMAGMLPPECNSPNKYMVIKTPNGGKIYVSDGEDGGIKLESPKGNVIELDDVAGRIRLRDRSGSYIEMSDGDIIIQAKGNVHLNPGS